MRVLSLLMLVFTKGFGMSLDAGAAGGAQLARLTAITGTLTTHPVETAKVLRLVVLPASGRRPDHIETLGVAQGVVHGRD